MMTEQEALVAASKPLPLHGSDNTRDLGGYPTENGGRTAYRRLVRSDSLEELTPADVEMLREYGVGCCIDFRTADTCEKHPSALSHVDGIDYYNVPIDDHIGNGDMAALAQYEDMGDLYIEFLERNKQEFCTALQMILQHPNQVTLYHCAAGKDRTGILSMLLLKLAGVPEDRILADYQVTEHYMISKFVRMKEFLEQCHQKIPEYCFSSAPEQMKKAMAYLNRKYGNVERYAEAIGVTKEECEKLKSVLKS